MVNCSNLIIKMSPRFVLGRKNVPCVAEVVNRLLKADRTDFNHKSSVTLRAPNLLQKSCEMRKQRNQRKFMKGTISAIIEIFRKIRYQHVQNNNFFHLMN